MTTISFKSAMTDPARQFLSAIYSSLDGVAPATGRVAFAGAEALPSVFAVTDLAAASIGAACLAVSRLTGDAPVTVDRRLASLWFGWTLRPEGWTLPPVWDPIAGDYRTEDGWIRLHTNAPHHRAAALGVLDAPGERDTVATAVARWRKDDLESHIVQAGGCAAAMRSSTDWKTHPQGAAVGVEPLIALTRHQAAPGAWHPRKERPLAGIRVLDLTRILAGPIATRFLAGYGAEVLRVDPPGWDEGAVISEICLGKNCARLDLERREDRARFETLLAEADLLVHGYRPGALDELGYDEPVRRALNPALIDVSLDAYGWSGPWQARRGFDSLVQMSAGIAETGMTKLGRDRPTPLPVQALDHATGYLMASAAVHALAERQARGGATTARVSLARTARLLTDASASEQGAAIHPVEEDWSADIEATDWGTARRLRPPALIDGVPMAWDRPARRLGSAEAARARR
jgi:hypothetical protein